ncbi:MAG: hypothetical protein JNL96_24295 [Planctomycetaceae bacterium]|nr:hypothetical protein [Planctomycetaceae bacterium]
MIHPFRNLIKLLLIIAVAVTGYGLAAQFAHGIFFASARTQEYRGWGGMFLVMSQLTIALPALIAAALISYFPFDDSRPLLGPQGRLILAAAAIASLTLGAVCGWPK